MTPSDKEQFQARDLNAVHVSRRHTFPEAGPNGDDLTVEFPKDKGWTAVPRAVGMKLAAIEGFEVRDDEGRPIVIKPGEATKAVVHLAPDEVIARLDELTMSALANRYEKIAGLPAPKDTKREDLIATLLQRAGAKPADERDIKSKVAA